MRLEGEAEAVVSMDGGEIRTEVKRGKSYHRVMDGMNYAVTSRGVKVEADGTAFTFEIDGNTEKVVSLESSLKVEIIAGSQSGWQSEIREGESFSYHEGGEEPQLAEVYPQDLDTEWLRWNRNLDKKLGLPLGVLAQVTEDDAGKGQADAESQGTPSPEDQSAPVASLPGQEENTPSSRPATPPKNAEKTLTLLAESNDSQVSFTWNISGYSGFQGFKLFRSETNPVPASPKDWWKYIDGQETHATVDDKVESGHTYYYRLGVYDHGDILGYSNSVQVTVKGQPQEPDILLTGIQAAGKVDLCWSVSEAAAYEGFKVLRSEKNSMPSYPEDWIAYVTEAMTYTDTNIKSGATYYYRIGIYRDGAIIKYSNAIKVIVP